MELDPESFLSVHFDSFEECFSTAKRVCLTYQDTELLDEVDLSVPLNPRHEAASLSLVLKKFSQEKPSSKSPFWTDYRDALTKSNEVYKDLCPFQESSLVIVEDPDSPEEKLKNWIVTNGGCCDLSVAKITVGDCQIRGLVSSTDLDPGSCPLSVPEWLLINDQTAADSDLGVALNACGLSKGELLTVIWTMIDAHDDESPNKLFWNTIPKDCLSSLNFTKKEVEYLKDTPAGLELEHAQQHLLNAYESIKLLLRSLRQAFPDFITDDNISYKNYLWVTHIWYAYAMQVEMSDGEVCSCLVPFVHLMNHSPWPHCIRYGRLAGGDPALEFPLFRECKKHEQVLLSYGPLYNQKLLIFYGFVLCKNPFDFISFEAKIMEELNSMTLSKKSLCLDRFADLDVDLEQKIMAGTMHRKLILCAILLGASESELEEIVWNENTIQDPKLEEDARLKVSSWLESMERTVLASEVWKIQSDDRASELCKNYLKTQRDALRSCLQRLESYNRL